MNTYYLTLGSPNNYSSEYYKGCYAPTDSAAGINAATTYRFDSNTMTTRVCRDACLGKSAKWMALKNSRTCMCGTNFSFGTGSYVPDAQCNTACPEDPSTMCVCYISSRYTTRPTAMRSLSTAASPPGGKDATSRAAECSPCKATHGDRWNP